MEEAHNRLPGKLPEALDLALPLIHLLHPIIYLLLDYLLLILLLF
jgi:hypothetical protein